VRDEGGRVGVGIRRRRVNDVLYARRLRRVDRCDVLCKPPTRPIQRVGAHEQQAVDAGKSARQRRGLLEVDAAHLYAFKAGELLRRAGTSDDLQRWVLAREQELDGTAAKLARGTGDKQGGGL
jgi:hypothetical protein